MLDIKWIRENPDLFDENLRRRNLTPLSEQVLAIDAERRKKQTEIQDLQNERNTIAREIGEAKRQGLDVEEKSARATAIKEMMPKLEQEEGYHAMRLREVLSMLPNLAFPEVPEGTDETSNVVVRTWGTPGTYAFEPKRHFDIGEELGLMDFKGAAKIAGARFVVLKGALARLERALGLFMLDLHTQEGGYTEISPPLIVREDAAFGTSQLPKFAEDLFQTTDGRWLIPTAEVSLTNLVRDDILEATELPKRFVAMTPCFRSEAGAAGKDTRGMIRQHQFYKVELVSVTAPEASRDEHERMTSMAEKVLQRLGLPYRVLMLCTGDMGLSSQKTYDLEVWLPGEAAFREISSCSNCGDYQARRMQARYRPTPGPEKRGPELVHTLNGSGVAVGRALIAILEVYQQADGSVMIPEVLRPYMNGMEYITKC